MEKEEKEKWGKKLKKSKSKEENAYFDAEK